MADYKTTLSGLSPSYWWELDGDGNSTVGSLDPDASDAPTFVASVVPTAAASYQCGDFDGSADYYRYPNAANINGAGTTQKTISAWVTTDTTASTSRAIWSTGGGTAGECLYQYGSKFYFCVYESTNIDYVESGTISTGTAYHIVAVMDSGADYLKLYINGTLVDTTTSLTIGASLDDHSGVKPRIGASASTKDHLGGTATFYDGDIADVAYWGETTPLNATQIQSLYEAGAGYFYTGTGETVTATGAGSSWTAGITKSFTGTGETITITGGGGGWTLTLGYTGTGATVTIVEGSGSWGETVQNRITYRQIIENGGGSFAHLWHVAGYPWAVTDTPALITALSNTDNEVVQAARKRLFGTNTWTDGATTVTPAYTVPIFPGLVKSFGNIRYNLDESNGFLKGGAWSVKVEDRILGHTWQHAASDDTIWGLDGLQRTARVKDSSVHGWGYLEENMLRNVGGSNPVGVDIEEQSNQKIFTRIANLSDGEWLTLWINYEAVAVNDKAGTFPSYEIKFADYGGINDYGRGLYRSRKQDHFLGAVAGLDPIIADVPGSVIGKYCWLYTIPLDDGALMQNSDASPIIIEELRGVIGTNISTEDSITNIPIREDVAALERTHNIEISRNLETSMAGFLFSRGSGGVDYTSVVENWQMPHLVIYEYDGGPDKLFLWVADAVNNSSYWHEHYIWLCPKNSTVFFETAQDVMDALNTELSKLRSGDQTAYSWPDGTASGTPILYQNYKIESVKLPDTGEVVRYRIAESVDIDGVNIDLTDMYNNNVLYAASSITGPLAWVFSLGTPQNQSRNIYTKIRENHMYYDQLETAHSLTLMGAGSATDSVGLKNAREENWMVIDRNLGTNTYVAIDTIDAIINGDRLDAMTTNSWGSLIPKYYYSWYWADYTPTQRTRVDIPTPSSYNTWTPPRSPYDNIIRVFLPEDTNTSSFAVGDTVYLGKSRGGFPQLTGVVYEIDGNLEWTNLVSFRIATNGYGTQSPDTLKLGTSMFYMQNAQMWGQQYTDNKYNDPHYLNKGSQIATENISDVFKVLLGETISGINVTKEIQNTDVPFFLDERDFTSAINWDQLDAIEKIWGQYYSINVSSRDNLKSIMKNELLIHRCVMTRYFDDSNYMWRYGFRQVGPLNASSANNSGYILHGEKSQQGAPVENHGDVEICNRIKIEAGNSEFIFEQQNASIIGPDSVRTLEIKPQITRFVDLNRRDLGSGEIFPGNIVRTRLYEAFLPFLNAISYPENVQTKQTTLLQYLFPTGIEIVVDDESARMPYTHAMDLDNQPALVVGWEYDFGKDKGKITYRLGGAGESSAYGYAPACYLTSGSFTKDVGSWTGTPEDHEFGGDGQPKDVYYFDCFDFTSPSNPTVRTSCGCGDYAVYAIEVGTYNWTPLPFTCSVSTAGVITMTGVTTNIDTAKDYVIVFQAYDSCEDCQQWWVFHADDNNTIGASGLPARRWF